MLRTTPSSRQPVVHVLVRPEPAVLRKQMSFGQLDPVYEKTAWFVVQVHFAPTPAAVPRAQLDENPPGPADSHEKSNEKPTALLVTTFSILTGKLERTLRSTLLSEPFDDWPSRSTFCVEARAAADSIARDPANASAAIRRFPGALTSRNMPAPHCGHSAVVPSGFPCDRASRSGREP